MSPSVPPRPARRVVRRPNIIGSGGVIDPTLPWRAIAEAAGHAAEEAAKQERQRAERAAALKNGTARPRDLPAATDADIIQALRTFYAGFRAGTGPNVNVTATVVAKTLAYERGLYAPHARIKKIAACREFSGRRGRIGVRRTRRK